MNVPLPGQPFGDSIVVASDWLDDNGWTALLLLLRPQAPYYAVADVNVDTAVAYCTTEHENINGAVAEYAQRGGDY